MIEWGPYIFSPFEHIWGFFVHRLTDLIQLRNAKALFGSFNICACNSNHDPECGYAVQTTRVWVLLRFRQWFLKLSIFSIFRSMMLNAFRFHVPWLSMWHDNNNSFSWNPFFIRPLHSDFQWICSVRCSCNFNPKGQTNRWFFLQNPREKFRFYFRSITNWSRKLLLSACYFRFNSLVQFDLDHFRNNFWLDHFQCKYTINMHAECIIINQFFAAVTLIFWIMAIIVNNLLIWIVNITDGFIFKCDGVENVFYCFEFKIFCRLRQIDNSIDLFSFHNMDSTLKTINFIFNC